MIKTVQVEEKRRICDVCGTNFAKMHGPTDTCGWLLVHISETRTLDICPDCASKLIEVDWDKYLKGVNENNG